MDEVGGEHRPASLMSAGRPSVSRVIVAMPERRGTIPVAQLLHLRMNGIQVQDAATVLEQSSGKIEIEDLWPSSLIFSEGFHVTRGYELMHRVFSVLATFALLLFLPVIPLLIVLIRLDFRGPILYRQKRVGLERHHIRVL